MDVEDLYLKNLENDYKIHKCVKCRVNNANIKLPSQRIYCRKCFDGSTNKLFQMFIKKNRLRLNKRVMIAFSGGASSSTLVHLLLQSFLRNKHVQYPFEPVVVYVDFIHDDSPKCRLINKPIYDYLSSLPFESHIFYKSQLDDFKFECTRPRHSQLLDYLKQVAIQLNIENIMTGHNANHLASLTFTLMGLGLGQDVLALIQSETVISSVNIFKPLKGFLAKEIAFYNLYCNVQDFSLFDFGNNPDSDNSSTAKEQQLLYSSSNEFLNQLQMSNECTINTILRTCEKFKDHHKLD